MAVRTIICHRQTQITADSAHWLVTFTDLDLSMSLDSRSSKAGFVAEDRNGIIAETIISGACNAIVVPNSAVSLARDVNSTAFSKDGGITAFSCEANFAISTTQRYFYGAKHFTSFISHSSSFSHAALQVSSAILAKKETVAGMGIKNL